MFDYCAENNITFIPFYPLAAGLLAGKYDESSKFDDLRSKLPFYQEDEFKENLAKVDQLKSIAEKYEEEAAQDVLAFYLTRPSVGVIIPGAKKGFQIKENMRAGTSFWKMKTFRKSMKFSNKKTVMRREMHYRFALTRVHPFHQRFKISFILPVIRRRTVP